MSEQKEPAVCPLAVCWECGRAVDRWSDSPFGPHCLGCTADGPDDGDTVPEPTPLYVPDLGGEAG